MHTRRSNDHVISQDPATRPVVERPVISSQKKVPVAVLAVLGVALIIVGGVWYLNGMSFNFRRESDSEFLVEPIDDTVIAKVGVEEIYGEDLKYKKSLVPEAALTPELEQDLFNRLIDESIILQAGADADYVNLSTTVFNSPLKNQKQRQTLITQVTDEVNKSTSYKKGIIVSIWFMNDEPGPVGYEAGQQIALEKITALHSAVKVGSMTIKQAGEAIRNDTTLAQLDPSYRSNAYREFDTSLKDKLSFDDEFHNIIVSLEKNEVSDVITIQDHPESNPEFPKQDALYSFGQVTEVKIDGPPSFNAWFESVKQSYEVIRN